MLEELQKRIAKVAGVTLIDNHLTIRFNFGGDLVDIHTVVQSVNGSREIRNRNLIEEAIDWLRGYYNCLSDETLAKELASCVKVPETNNDQADYENVRDQIEALAIKREKYYPD